MYAVGWRCEMRAWFGTAILGAIGLGADITAIARGWPWPAVVALGVVGAVATVMTIPVAAPHPETAFVRGDASASRFVDITTDADVFIDGDAREALFLRVLHRSRRRSR
jgi:hypothetical protein